MAERFGGMVVVGNGLIDKVRLQLAKGFSCRFYSPSRCVALQPAQLNKVSTYTIVSTLL